MKMEIEFARQQHEMYSIPARSTPDVPPVSLAELNARRRTIKLMTDSYVNVGLLNGDIVALLHTTCEVMTAVGGTCAQLGTEPAIKDFLLGAQALMEHSRDELAKWLLVRDWERVKACCAQIQITCAGVCYVLNLPYREAMAITHEHYMAAEPPVREDYVALMRDKGFDVRWNMEEDGDAA